MGFKKKTQRILIAIVVFLVAVPAGFSVWLYRELHSPVAHGKANDYIEIPRGSMPEGIVNKLLAEGVIRRTWPLLFYIKLTGSAKLIKAGDYRFPSPISALGVHGFTKMAIACLMIEALESFQRGWPDTLRPAWIF